MTTAHVTETPITCNGNRTALDARTDDGIPPEDLNPSLETAHLYGDWSHFNADGTYAEL